MPLPEQTLEHLPHKSFPEKFPHKNYPPPNVSVKIDHRKIHPPRNIKNIPSLKKSTRQFAVKNYPPGSIPKTTAEGHFPWAACWYIVFIRLVICRHTCCAERDCICIPMRFLLAAAVPRFWNWNSIPADVQSAPSLTTFRQPVSVANHVYRN